jgi:hypothetical protein
MVAQRLETGRWKHGGSNGVKRREQRAGSNLNSLTDPFRAAGPACGRKTKAAGTAAATGFINQLRGSGDAGAPLGDVVAIVVLL